MPAHGVTPIAVVHRQRRISTPTVSWQNVPDYGDVGYPNEPRDWAPYRNGNWVYEPYYGWTWVGSEPWGWAPYHYGRWFLWRFVGLVAGTGRTRATVRSGRQPTFRSGDGAADLASASDCGGWGGFGWLPSGRVTGSIRGGADIAAGTAL